MRLNILLIFLFIGTSVLAQNPDRDSIDFSKFSNMQLSDALGYLTDMYGIPFSYNPESIHTIKVPEVNDQIKTISDFLDLTLTDSKINYTNISGTYVLFPRAETNKTDDSLRRNFSLSGIVRDKNTKESLPYAAISVGGTSISVTSNTDGKFSLLNIPVDTLRITIRYLGYIPYSESLRNTEKNDIAIFEMSPRLRNLPSVEVTAHTQELVEILPEPSRIDFNPEQISELPNLGESDVFSALRRLPGIRGGLDASTGLKIRGGNSDENLFLFDGITVYHVDHFYGFLSAFNTNIIKNIQIDKGAYGARYGGRTSGVVNITGIDGNKVQPSFQAELNSLSTNIVGQLPIVKGKASVVVAFRQSITNVIQTVTYKNMFNNIFNSSIPAIDNNTVNVFDSDNIPVFSYNDFNAKVNFKPSEKDAISLSYYEGNDKTKIQFDGSLKDLSRRSLDNSSWGTNGVALKWSRKWNKRLFTYANYAASRYKSNLNAQESFYINPTNELLSKIYFEQLNTVNDNTLRLDNTWEIDQKTRLEFGYWISHYSVGLQAQNQSEILIDSLADAVLQAGYAELFRSLGKWNLSFGLRSSNYSEMSRFYWEPRFAARYQVSDELSFKGAYGIFHQIIRRLNERSLYLSIPETWTLSGESTIPVLRSDHYVFGFLYQPGDWQIDLEGYHKYESGTVDFLLPEFGFDTGNLDQYAIDGDRKINGFDLTVKRSFTTQNLLLGYSYINSETRYPNINFGNYFESPGTSVHEINVVYNYELKRWDFSAAFVLASGQPYTPVLGTYIIKLPNGEEQQFVSLGGINSKNLDWYNRLDIGVNYTLPIKKGVFQAGISIYNLYNSLGVKYIDYFEIPDTDSEHFDLGQREIKSLGFTPSLFLKIKI